MLILDVDETLIYASKSKLTIEAAAKVAEYFIYERPFLKTFLDAVKADYKLAIWSSASDDYVLEVVKNTILVKYEFDFIWGRSKATYRRDFELDEQRIYGNHRDHYHYVKSLKKVRKLGYSINRMLIVDDTPRKAKLNYGNAIYPNSYLGDIEDTELKILAKYLKSIKEIENYRRLEKRNWRDI